MFRRRVFFLICLFCFGGYIVAAPAAGTLPYGFAGINVGDPWLLVKDRHEFKTIGSVTSQWDRHARECGSITLIADLDDGALLVTVNDFVVTAVSETRKISPGSDLLQIRQRIVGKYGPPNTEILKDIFGAEIDTLSNVNYIVLYYDANNPIRINISGTALWRHQTRVQYQNQRLHENKTHRCVRHKQRGGG